MTGGCRRWLERPAPPGVVVLLVLLWLGGSSCSEDEPGAAPGTREPRPTAYSSGSLPGTDAPEPLPEPPDDDPLAFNFYEPVTLPEVGVRAVGLTDDVALTLTADTLTARVLPALEVAWAVPPEPGRRFTDVHVDREAGTVVAVATGRDGDDDAFSVVELDAVTGAPRGRVDVTVPHDPRSEASGTVASVVGAATDRVVLDVVPAATPLDDPIAQAAARHTTVVVELGSPGRLMWSSRPDTPLGMTGGLVVVHTGTARRGGAVVARDLDDGQPVWSALSDTKAARWVGASEGRVVLTATGLDDASSLSVLDVGDGLVSASQEVFSWVWRCWATPRPIALCSIAGRPSLRAVDLATGGTVWRLPRGQREAPTVSTVLRDHVYGLADDHGVVLDARTGAELASDTGAAPQEVCAWGGLTIIGGQAVFQPAVPVADGRG